MSQDDDDWNFNVDEAAVKKAEKSTSSENRPKKMAGAKEMIRKAQNKNLRLDNKSRVERKSRSDAEAYVGKRDDNLADPLNIADRVTTVVVDVVTLGALKITGGFLAPKAFPFVWDFCDTQLGDVSFLEHESSEEILGYVITFFLVFFVFGFMGAILRRSPGKFVTKSVVEDIEGGDASFGQALMRETVGKLISTVTVIGLVLMFITKEKRGLHDYLFKTVVRKA